MKLFFFPESIIFAILQDTSNNTNNPIATSSVFRSIYASTKLNSLFFYTLRNFQDDGFIFPSYFSIHREKITIVPNKRETVLLQIILFRTIQNLQLVATNKIQFLTTNTFLNNKWSLTKGLNNLYSLFFFVVHFS